MSFKILKIGSVFTLATASVIAGASYAQAASLTGAGSIGFNGTVRIFGVEGVDGEIATAFDFIPPVNDTPFQVGDDGAAIIGFDVATGGFEGFDIEDANDFPPALGEVGTGLQADVTIQELPVGNVFTTEPTPLPVENFVVLAGGDDPDTTFTVDDIETASFEQIGDDVTVTVQVGGTFFSNGLTFDGSGIYTAQFEDLTEAEFLAGLETGVVLTETFSADFVAVEEDIVIPEPTSVLSLAGAFGLAASFLRKKQQKLS